MNELDFWKNVPKLSVDEFMCLLFGLEPGAVRFDYGNPKEWPKGAEPVYRTLIGDVGLGVDSKLRVVFDNDQDNPWNNEYAASHYFHTGEPWWYDGKIYTRQLKEWLIEKRVPSKFFGVNWHDGEISKTDSVPDCPNDNLPEPPSKPAPAVTEASPQNVPAAPVAMPQGVSSTSDEKEPSASEGEKQLIPRKLWEQKPLKKVCDDMRVAKFEDDAIAYALYHWRGIKNITEIGTILRGDAMTESGREKHARKMLKKAGERYYTE